MFLNNCILSSVKQERMSPSTSKIETAQSFTQVSIGTIGTLELHLKYAPVANPPAILITSCGNPKSSEGTN